MKKYKMKYCVVLIGSKHSVISMSCLAVLYYLSQLQGGSRD